MNILVFGCGVIGSYLVHQLCRSGNDVTVAAHGKTKKTLERKGLRIYHKLQKRRTVDRPRVIETEEAENRSWDVVFSAMQGQQQHALAGTLSRLDTKMFVLVGNDLEPGKLEKKIRTDAPVLFGFQATAGLRKDTYTVCVHAGKSGLTVGGLHRAPSRSELQMLKNCFAGTGYRIAACNDMDGWLWSHAAFILPIVFVSYACGCDLRKAPLSAAGEILTAAEEAYGLVRLSGRKIRPAEDEKLFRNPAARALMKTVLAVIAKTSIGELAATDHCRNAVTEMEYLDSHFEALRREFPVIDMPVWRRLRAAMPSWEELHDKYKS